MSLSQTVARPPPKIRQTKGPIRRDQGPFGGMNRTTAPFRLLEEQRREVMRKQAQGLKQGEAQEIIRPSRSKSRLEKQPREPGDMKALKMQKSLTSISYAHRANIKEKMNRIELFDDMELLQSIQKAIPEEALRGLATITPTPIQRLAIPALLGMDGFNLRGATAQGMKQFLLAAETGSGKTLAYLLPVLDAVKRADNLEVEMEEAEAEAAVERERKQNHNPFALGSPPLSNEMDADVARPKAIILLPTSELVEQVGRLFKLFSHAIKLRVSLISSAYTAPVIRRRLFGPSGVDVVLSTPHLLSSIADSDPNILSRVTHLVADEADSLFDRGFAPLTTAIIDRATPSLKQLILCSATIPRSLDSYLQKRFPDIHRLTTPNLHAIPRRVQLSIVDIDKDPYRGNRDLACADSIWSIGRAAAEDGEASLTETKRVIVFVNEREEAEELTKYLLTKGIDAVSLNRDTTDQRRDGILASFTSSEAKSVSGEKDIQEAAAPASRTPRSPRILANTKVIVMTDIGSRGIDTVAVRNVVLYDVPHTTIDFIHRLGRIGRMGRRGRGLILVGKDDRRDVVREVREGMFRGQALI